MYHGICRKLVNQKLYQTDTEHKCQIFRQIPKFYAQNIQCFQAGVNVSSSNPYVFMEVGPHTVTINSISAHVVSADGTPVTTPVSTATASMYTFCRFLVGQF